MLGRITKIVRIAVITIALVVFAAAVAIAAEPQSGSTLTIASTIEDTLDNGSAVVEQTPQDSSEGAAAGTSTGSDNSSSTKIEIAESSTSLMTQESSAPTTNTTPAKVEVKSSFAKVDGVWTYYDAAGKATPMPKLKPGWVKQDKIWYYFPNNNEFTRDNWATVQGAKYRFDSLGHMRIGWFDLDGKRYFAQSSGAIKRAGLNRIIPGIG